MPDFIRFGDPSNAASTMEIGSTIPPDPGIDWDVGNVIQRSYIDTITSQGGALAYDQVQNRSVKIPFIYKGTSVDDTNQLVQNMWACAAPGNVLDVRFEGASWVTRFDIEGARVLPARDIRYQRQSIIQGQLELSLRPWGYTPTWMLAFPANTAAGWGLPVAATVIGDIPAQLRLQVKFTNMQVNPTLRYASNLAIQPLNGYAAMYIGAGAGSQPIIISPLVPSSASLGVGNVGQAASIFTGATFTEAFSATALLIDNNITQYALGAGPQGIAYFAAGAASIPIGSGQFANRFRGFIAYTPYTVGGQTVGVTLQVGPPGNSQSHTPYLSKTSYMTPRPPTTAMRMHLLDMGELDLSGFAGGAATAGFNFTTIAVGLVGGVTNAAASASITYLINGIVMLPIDDYFGYVPTAPDQQFSQLPVYYIDNGATPGAFAGLTGGHTQRISAYRGGFPIQPNASGGRGIYVLPLSNAGIGLPTTAVPSVPVVLASSGVQLQGIFQPRWMFMR